MVIGRPHSGPVSHSVAYLALFESVPIQVPGTGTPQIGLISPAIQPRAVTAAGGAPVTIDTGFSLPPGHGADIEARYNATDVIGDVTSSSKVTASIRNIPPGGFVVAGQTVDPPVGDAALGTAAPSFSVVGGTLHITFTPPAAYPNPINWIFLLSVLGN